MLSILFIHDNYPGQFGLLGSWLARTGWDVGFATAAPAQDPALSGARRILRYAPHRKPSASTHPYAQPMDRAAINGQAFARAALAARADGYSPAIVVAHSGWGAGMFAKDIFPGAAFVPYCEWWYRYPGPDVAFLASLSNEVFSSTPDTPLLERTRNAPIAMDLAASDAAISPTLYQARQFPETFQSRLTIHHDGIDTNAFSPEPAARRSTLGGLVAEDARVVTYVSRGLEPHRGFPQFMAALSYVLAGDPRAVAVIAGENRVAYGDGRLRKIDWKAKALAELDIDPARVRFTGRLPRAQYLALLRRSDAHVYLTVPFVLSWSMLEAMSVGCAMVLSDTAPVREYASEVAAHLVPFGEPRMIAEAILDCLCGGTEDRRSAARAAIETRLAARMILPEKARMLAQWAAAT